MKKPKPARITFRKEKPSGFFPPKIYRATQAGERIASIQEHGRGTGTFFWYGRPGGVHVNTCNRPATLEECKADIVQRFTNPTP
jgi:hypothetical protein